MNDETAHHRNEDELRELVERFAWDWYQNRETSFPLPQEVLFDLEGLPENPSQELRRFQRELTRYEGGTWTRTGAVNPVFIQKLKRKNFDSFSVIQNRYKDAERLRSTGRAATELYEELNSLTQQPFTNNTQEELATIMEKIRRLAIYSFAGAKAMDYESKQLIAKTLKLHDFIEMDNSDKTMAFSEEDVTHIRKQWNHEQLVRSAAGANRPAPFGRNNMQDRGRGGGRPYGRQGFGRGGPRFPPNNSTNQPQPSQPHQQQ
ncbi:hypothetical protein BJV82DRAFT_578841 [Fennellomyces sp. T-0311]|nr:hypothetical protein BJV82DRAFT_578841 [Fennellomyces sp. T-0311]